MKLLEAIFFSLIYMLIVTNAKVVINDPNLSKYFAAIRFRGGQELGKMKEQKENSLNERSHVFGNNNAVMQVQQSNSGSNNNSLVLGVPYLTKIMENERPLWSKSSEAYRQKTANEEERVYQYLQKRSIVKLIADTNAKLDVPKTWNNVGRAVNEAFENRRSPVYHLRNVVGSTSDAFMSSLNIIPRDLIIPSQYAIVHKDAPILSRNFKSNLRNRGLNNRTDKDAQNVDSLLEESIRNSQTTLTHLNDAYGSVRRAVFTTRHAIPRTLIKSLRIPAVQRRSYRNSPPTYEFNEKNLHDDIQNTVGILQAAKRVAGVSSMQDFMSHIKKTIETLPPLEAAPPERDVELTRSSSQSELDNLREAQNSDSNKILDLLLALEQNSQNQTSSIKLSDNLQEIEDRHRKELIGRYKDADKNKVLFRNGFSVNNELLKPFMGASKQRNSLVTNDNNYHKSPKHLNMEKGTESSKRLSMDMGRKLVTPYMGKFQTVTYYGPLVEIPQHSDYYD